MRFNDGDYSDHVASQNFGGGGGGGALLFGLVFSRFGLGGGVVLVVGMLLLGGNPLGLMGSDEAGPTNAPGPNADALRAQGCTADVSRRFSCQVLKSTEVRWGAL